MRKLIIAALVAAIATTIALVPSTASASTKTYIGCATSAYDVGPRVAPRNCDTWYPWLSHAESAGYLTKMHWRHWGARRATTTAIMRYRDGRIPTRVVAYRPRSLFGMRIYTRLSTKTPYGGGTMRLPLHYDIWPEL